MFSESPPLLGAGCHPAALDDCSTRLQGEEEEEGGEGIGSTQHVQQLQALLLAHLVGRHRVWYTKAPSAH